MEAINTNPTVSPAPIPTVTDVAVSKAIAGDEVVEASKVSKTRKTSKTSKTSKGSKPETLVTSDPIIDDAFSLSALSALGIKGNVKGASKIIANAGGFVPEGASSELLSVAATVVTNAKTAETAGRKTALALAMIEASGEYAKLRGPDGKLFKRATQLFSAMFPALADSTVRNYLNAGRTVYLPAAKGELEQDLLPIAELEPGTALSACAALNDGDARKELPQALKEAIVGKKGITQSALKKAVKVAKQRAEGGGNDKEVRESSPAADVAAAHDTEVQALRVKLKTLMAVDAVEGDISILIKEDNVARFMALLEESFGTYASSKALVDALIQVLIRA